MLSLTSSDRRRLTSWAWLMSFSFRFSTCRHKATVTVSLVPHLQPPPSLCTSIRAHLGLRARHLPRPNSLQHPRPPQDPGSPGSRESLGSKHTRGDPCTTLRPRQTQEADPQDLCLARALAMACVYLDICNFIFFFFKRAPKLYKLQTRQNLHQSLPSP